MINTGRKTIKTVRDIRITTLKLELILFMGILVYRANPTGMVIG